MKQKKKKELAWESAIPIENKQRQGKKEDPLCLTMINGKNVRHPFEGFVSRGPGRRHNRQSFEGDEKRVTFDRRGRGYYIALNFFGGTQLPFLLA
tara:strand:- start:91 stop:375 length:285 start_codon:yes stop_codon:yes gene_type:complete